MDGVETIRALTERDPGTRIIALTSFKEESLVQDALDAGALGYLLKDIGADELAEAIRAVHRGEPKLSPQEVVSAFYRWYIGYPGNPLVDREYRESPYLAESFVGEVDEIAKEGFRVDPLLLAQDIPERFTADGVEVSEDEASVVLSLYWGGNPTPTERRIDLRLIDGAWMMTDVSRMD